MIRCSNIRKAYDLGGRRVNALCGLTLDIPGPGFFGVMGQSGSGKSTLLHLLAGLDAPDSGEISVAGQSLGVMNDAQATLYRRKTIGIVFQQFNLIPTLTAIENVELPGVLAGEPAITLRDRARSLLDQLGVGERAQHRPDAMSGGEQQRVAIARALSGSPPVLLADEPSGNLDSANSLKLWELLADLARTMKITIVMVTHEPAAAAWCDRVYVLRDGILVGEFPTLSVHEGTERKLDAAGVAARYQQYLR